MYVNSETICKSFPCLLVCDCPGSTWHPLEAQYMSVDRLRAPSIAFTSPGCLWAFLHLYFSDCVCAGLRGAEPEEQSSCFLGTQNTERERRRTTWGPVSARVASCSATPAHRAPTPHLPPAPGEGVGPDSGRPRHPTPTGRPPAELRPPLPRANERAAVSLSCAPAGWLRSPSGSGACCRQERSLSGRSVRPVPCTPAPGAARSEHGRGGCALALVRAARSGSARTAGGGQRAPR